MTPIEFQSLHVLVVDDEVFMRQLIARLLREIGIKTIYQASDGKEGLEILKSFTDNIDLILCDLEMPKMDGLQFIRRVRSNKMQNIAELPVIVLTGHASDTIVRTAMGLNVQGYLVKPVSKNMLVERIAQAMGDTTENS